MKVGLLICDHVNPEYRSEHSDYPEMFVRLFPELDFKFYEVCDGEFPARTDECDCYMTTGSRRSVYEPLDWIVRLEKFIWELYQQKKYFVGFCFGHQLLGEALGGKVGKAPVGWCVGVHQFQVARQMPWMQPPRSTFNLLMSCRDQILVRPPQAHLLGSNDDCLNAVIQVSDHMIGIQAHPEFTKDYDRLLMEKRIASIGEERVEEGIDSLKSEVDSGLIHDWILNFLEVKR